MSGSTQRITYARRFDEEKGLMENITIEELKNLIWREFKQLNKLTGKMDPGVWKMVLFIHERSGRH